ncbi:hypothetical protein AB0B50_11875 [Streptomyces sp. NPDC041068]|uniref:hypothetical protein n=1 Tax=Streptomyces sp. NPDC041068 TaxID=3155130 RepID=UPI0033D4A388
MPDVGLYAEAALRKTIFGVPLGTSPEEWESALGNDFLDDVRKSRMRRDYGLIEVAFERRSGLRESVSVSLQIHRMYVTDESSQGPGNREPSGRSS